MTVQELVVVTIMLHGIIFYLGMRIGYEFSVHGDKTFNNLVSQTLGFFIALGIFAAIAQLVMHFILYIFRGTI